MTGIKERPAQGMSPADVFLHHKQQIVKHCLPLDHVAHRPQLLRPPHQRLDPTKPKKTKPE